MIYILLWKRSNRNLELCECLVLFCFVFLYSPLMESLLIQSRCCHGNSQTHFYMCECVLFCFDFLLSHVWWNHFQFTQRWRHENDQSEISNRVSVIFVLCFSIHSIWCHGNRQTVIFCFVFVILTFDGITLYLYMVTS